MGKKVEYKRELKKTSDATTPLDIVDVKVPRGYKRTIQHVSAEDETLGCTELRIGYLRDTTYHWWVEQETPQAGVLYWMRDAKVLEAGDILVIRFTGTTNNDVLAAYVDGFTEKVNP